MLVYKDLHWWTVLRIYQIFLVKLKIFLSKMQVNTKEILLNHPSKGLAHCALYFTVLVLSRSGDGANLSEETLARFKVAIKEHGYDPEELCTFDNSGCTN